MTNDDLLYRHRLLLFAKAEQLGVSRAYRELGYHRSRYYRWKPLVERNGLEMLRPRERRRPRMPNQQAFWTEERITSFALGHPALGPRRVAAQLRMPIWGGIVVSDVPASLIAWAGLPRYRAAAATTGFEELVNVIRADSVNRSRHLANKVVKGST